MLDPQQTEQRREPDPLIDGVRVEQLRRIMWVMREKYPHVLAANRFFEEETGIHNEVGHNNLNDALSHLGTLFERASEMTAEQQYAEVHDFEGHLRRSMMESYELVYRQRMGEVARTWAEHERLCEPLRRNRSPVGAARKEELETLRRRCKNLLEDGRRAKRGHDWEAWQRGTEALIEACRAATTLLERLDAGIEAATNQHRQRREFRVGVALAIVLCVIGIAVGAGLTAVLA